MGLILKKMNKYSLLVLLSVFTILNSNAQKLQNRWSEQYNFATKEDGRPSYVMGENDKYVYVQFADLNLSGKKLFRIAALDKKTLKKKQQYDVYNQDSYRKFKDYYLSESFITDEGIVLVWVEKDKDNRIVYAQSLDVDLRSKAPLQRLNKINVENSRKIKRPAKYSILSNSDVEGSEIVIVEEKAMMGDGNIRVEVKTFNSDFKLVKTMQQELPFEFKDKKGLFSSSVGSYGIYYYYGNDGKLHFRNSIYYSKEERKELKNNDEWEDAPKSFYSVIDIQNETIKSIPFNFKGRSLLDYNFSVSSDGVKIYGFYHDDNDESKFGISGVFYIKMSSDLEIEVKRFNPFSSDLLAETFVDDEIDRKGCLKDGICCFKNNSGKSRYGNSLSSSYSIERSILTNEDITMFCSMTENHTYQTCDDDGNCTTHYYCLKYNVTCFKVDYEGNLIWVENVNRLYRYEAWDVMDLEVIASDKGYYVLYNSILDHNGNRKNKEDLKNNLDYVFFDRESGDSKQSTIVKNSANASKADKKSYDLSDIYSFNNTFYVLTDPKSFFLGCFWFYTNKTGYVGRLEPIEKR